MNDHSAYEHAGLLMLYLDSRTAHISLTPCGSRGFHSALSFDSAAVLSVLAHHLYKKWSHSHYHDRLCPGVACKEQSCERKQVHDITRRLRAIRAEGNVRAVFTRKEKYYALQHYNCTCDVDGMRGRR